jgi:glycosyltransferase involved in cell wall biosynthesis
MLRRGAPSERILVICPPADLAGTAGDRPLRQELGLGETDLVLLAPGESTRAAGHRDALWVASILHVLDPRWRLLIWGRGPDTDLLVRLAAKFHQPALLCVVERKLNRSVAFEELVSAADMVLFAPRAAPQVLPLLMCMAGGLPIVASARGRKVGCLQEGTSAAVVGGNSPKLLAARLLALAADTSARQSLAENARQAASQFTPERFVEEYRRLYRHI